MNDGDIYRWEYNKDELKRLNHGNNGGTTYWAKSRIGIWDGERNVLKDTYWTGSGNTQFSVADIINRLVVTFVANINDLEPCQRSEFNNYDDSDCVDISHANMINGGFYIKKGAVPSIEKKRRVIEAHIKHHEEEEDYHRRQILQLSEILRNLSVDSHVPYDRNVFIS